MKEDYGKRIVPGITIGKIFLYRKEEKELPEPCRDIAKEQDKFEQAM